MSQAGTIANQKFRWYLAAANIFMWMALSLSFLLADGSAKLDALTENTPTALGLAALLGLWIVLNLPFQFLAGYSYTLETGGSFARWILLWLRSTLLVAAVYYGTAWLLVVTLDLLGPLGLIAVVATEMILLTGFALSLARLASPLSAAYGSDLGRPLWELRSQLRPMTGSVLGLPGNEVLVMPEKWKGNLPEKVADVFLLRRHALINQGSLGRGFLYAFAWSMLAFAAAFFLSGVTQGSLGSLGTLSCWFTLIAPLGWIAPLRWLNRRAVFETDAWAYYEQVDLDYIRALAVKTDELRWGGQGGVPSWAGTLSPVPSASDRMGRFGNEPTKSGGWNAIGQALLMSWAGLSLISLSLPSMIGRPSLRVIAFSD